MEQNQPNLFVSDELDGVNLDSAETEDLETNYVALIPNTLLSLNDNDSTGSGLSCGSDSDSSWTGRNKIICSSQIKLKSRSEGLNLGYSLRDVLPNCAGWNKIPHIIEDVFRMNSYIVDPNYLLCISKYNTRQKTIDNILSRLQTSRLSLPKWSQFEYDILEVLSIYEKFEGIPNSLSNFNEARVLLTQFLAVIEDKFDNLSDSDSESKRKGPSTNFFDDMIATIRKFIEELKKLEISNNEDEARKHTKSLGEDLFEQYFSVLFSFFNEITNSSFRYVAKRRRTIECSLDISKDTKVITAIPDIEIFAGYKKCVLVGEVRRYGAQHGKLHETDRGHRVKDDCTHSAQGDDDHGRGQQTNLKPEEPPLKQAKLNKDVCQEDAGQVEALGPEASGSKSTSNTGTDLSKKNEAEGECGIDGGDSKRKCECHYRHLDKKELYKINGFLPQLFGGMLVSKCENGGLFEIGNRYENIQLGFSIQGFKLRFVRMVLRDFKERRPPTVEEFLDNKRFKCDFFLTQEFNLFKRKHLIMFFQIMYAISYCSSKYFHSPY